MVKNHPNSMPEGVTNSIDDAKTKSGASDQENMKTSEPAPPSHNIPYRTTPVQAHCTTSPPDDVTEKPSSISASDIETGFAARANRRAVMLHLLKTALSSLSYYTFHDASYEHYIHDAPICGPNLVLQVALNSLGSGEEFDEMKDAFARINEKVIRARDSAKMLLEGLVGVQEILDIVTEDVKEDEHEPWRMRFNEKYGEDIKAMEDLLDEVAEKVWPCEAG